jgi:tetratricopeptide (TPR) repeat protein
MKQHIGIVLSIALLAGDYRATGKKGTIRMGSFFNTSEYFARFARRVQQHKNIVSARVELADELHMAEEYAAALKILKLVLKEDTKDVDALCLCGDIHCHLENYPLAIRYAQKAFLLQKNEIDVYRVLCDAYQGLQNWKAVIKWACNGLDFAETKGEALFLLRSKANAEMELNEFEEAKHTISEIKGFYNGLMIKPLEEKLKQKQRNK